MGVGQLSGVSVSGVCDWRCSVFVSYWSGISSGGNWSGVSGCYNWGGVSSYDWFAVHISSGLIADGGWDGGSSGVSYWSSSNGLNNWSGVSSISVVSQRSGVSYWSSGNGLDNWSSVSSNDWSSRVSYNWFAEDIGPGL
ncbi:PREDICTED: uncharacterized protein LOC108561866, partial [Nicrophorus vespilloides]|uniref:Uncharacterized protein LOC108561866 n=1 Tax=Nicrophorus vespilloides TaxID=110193 RepID=A0ABM1MLL1_NICVS